MKSETFWSGVSCAKLSGAKHKNGMIILKVFKSLPFRGVMTLYQTKAGQGARAAGCQPRVILESMQLSSRCYAVTGLGYSAPWCVNAGFVTGDELTLVVDTGANRLAAQSIHGYASAARPGNQLRVINTEKHFDHIG